MDELKELSRERLMEMEGISDNIADAMVAGLASPRVRLTIDAMRRDGLTLATPTEEKQMGNEIEPILKDLWVCVTGTLSRMTRNEAHACIIALQGTPDSSVTKKTNVLVVGDKPGSKVKKAQQNGARIWSEAEFLDRMTAAGLA